MDHDDQDPLAGIEIFFPQLLATLYIHNTSELLLALAFSTSPVRKIYGATAVGAL
jgi:hypothetical protein